MSTAPPQLAPIFRSDSQLRILGATYLEPERHFTIPGLVVHTGRPQPTVAREVQRLVTAGLLDSELRSGRRTVWAAAASPIFDELRSILLKTVGPKPVVERHLRKLPHVSRAVVYGSWAGRYHGEAGAFPQDIDLMVISDTDVADAAEVAEIRAAADDASRELDRDVNVTILTTKEWDEEPSGFITHLKSGPLVDLDLS